MSIPHTKFERAATFLVPEVKFPLQRFSMILLVCFLLVTTNCLPRSFKSDLGENLRLLKCG